MEFNEYIFLENEKFKALQDVEGKEVVSDEDAICANTYLNQIDSITCAADLYLFCASLNLMNTYVKQGESNISYNFKTNLYKLIRLLPKEALDYIEMDFQYSGGTLFIIEIFNMQFSFHGVQLRRLTDLLDIYRFQDIQWDGIRKQKCAVSVFNSAIKGTEYSNNPKIMEYNRLASQAKEESISKNLILDRYGIFNKETILEDKINMLYIKYRKH